MLFTKRKKEVVLKGRFYLVHGRCTNRTLMMYEWYMAIIRNRNELFNTTS